jgi:hypothetical protein
LGPGKLIAGAFFMVFLPSINKRDGPQLPMPALIYGWE